MKYSLTKPCKQCPFRTDIDGYLTPARAHEITASLLNGRCEFPRHKTIEVDDDGDEEGCGEIVNDDKAVHCAGALIFLEMQDAPHQMMRICERLGSYDRSKLDMKSTIFSSSESMVRHMKKQRRA